MAIRGARSMIQAGDRFARRDNPTLVWVVVARIDLPWKLPAHFRIIQEQPPHRQILISEAALLDRSLYAYLGRTQQETQEPY